MFYRNVFLIFPFLIIFPITIIAQEHTSLTHGGSVEAVAYSPVNTSLLASVGGKHTIKLWDLEKNIETTLGSHKATINTIAFSPDGQRLVSGSDDYTIKVWDVNNKRHQTTLYHVTNFARSQVKAVAFSPDGQRFVTSGWHVKIWDIHTLRELTTIRHGVWVIAVAISPDGQFLALGDESGLITIKNFRTFQTITQFRGDADLITALEFSPDNLTLASAGYFGDVVLWNISSWEQIGTFSNDSTVTSISFSPDSKTLVSTGYETVNLWSIQNGDNIGTLSGHKGWIHAADFSPDGTSLMSGGSDGTLRIWDVTSFQSDLTDLVRIIYFVPRGRTPQPDMWLKLDKLIKDVQGFYAEQMEAHGYGRKTFTYETDDYGETLVHQVDGNFHDFYYHLNTTHKIHSELATKYDMSKHVYLIVAELSSQAIEEVHVCGVGGSFWQERDHQVKTRGGYAVIPASGDCFDEEYGTIVAAHELGHAFGLEHDFRDDKYLMSYGQNPDQLSVCAIEWLGVSRFFNTSNTVFNEPTSIHILTSKIYPPNATNFSVFFQVTDIDGIHQIQLLVQTTDADPALGTKLFSCQRIDAQSKTVEFDITSLTKYPINTIALQAIDVYGNITRQDYVLRAGEPTSVGNRIDINGDGIVDTHDLVLVAAHFGETVVGNVNPNPDVNGDGVVNIIDLLLVANEIDVGTTAAPIILAQSNKLDPDTVQLWISQAKQLPVQDAFVARGIAVLEKLLVSVLPTQTRLLENYPNPFNPETWIPYQLASSSDVMIKIYDIRGSLIRIIDLGHKPGGTYHVRTRAAYWDGRNAYGESVGSGIYFYTFSAGDYVATRKMMLRK